MQSSHLSSSNPVCRSASGSSRRSSSPGFANAIPAEVLPNVLHANQSTLSSSNYPDASTSAVPTLPNAALRRPFLKKPSPVELEKLLNKISFQIIKDWCSLLSIVVPLQRHKKNSFTQPLARHFWSKYSHYSMFSLTSLCEFNPGPVGTLYPPSEMPGYTTNMIDSASIKLKQMPFYDADDELIHPALYDSSLKEGTIVEAMVSMEALSLTSNIWGFIRVRSLQVLNINLDDYDTPAAPPAPNDGDDNGGPSQHPVASPSGVASAPPFELEDAGLSGLVMDADIAMGDSTEGTTSTTIKKCKATAQRGPGNNRRGKETKA